MAETREERISRLSQRFKSHAVGRKPETQRSRARHSFYIDSDLVEKVYGTYEDVDHELHPAKITKSDFLEALLEYGLAHVNEITASLREAAQPR